jgi:indolepyruvate ferredoxin oxidoreductase alpha subunit
MKHVGLNVAADPFINSAITGANGGMIVVAADDPSMHSSQNEQDSRFFGKFAMIPILEPANQQEAYDMVYYGFDFSEKYRIPILLRIPTRLAHSRSGVERKTVRRQNNLAVPDDLRQYVLLPAYARKKYSHLLHEQVKYEQESESSQFNRYIDGENKSKGIIVCGIAYNYFLENYPDRKVPFPVLKVGQYPLPKKMIKRLLSECKEILILEDGYPFVEEMINGLFADTGRVKGRLDGTIPRDGELNPNIVASALGIEETRGMDVPALMVNRPPSLCISCPHIDSFIAINEVMNSYTKGRVFSDIGCYTLGALQPFETINSCVDMGASITMAKGAADAGLVPSIAVIGDSTFSHSGMTGLLDAVNDKSPVTVFILDNLTTAMTGGQDSPGNGKIEGICKGVGVEEAHIHVIRPLKKYHKENVKIISEELAYQGVSVIIPRRECIVTSSKKSREKVKQAQNS